MADYSVIISLADHKKGDRWVGIPSIGPVTINGSQPSNALTRIRMHFKHTKGMLFKLDSNDGEIIIDDADTWEASIPEIEDFLPNNGEWSWDMEFYEENKTNPLTLYKGTITVHPDITQ